MSTIENPDNTDAEISALLVRLGKSRGTERGQILSYLARRYNRLGLSEKALATHEDALELAPRDPRVTRSSGLARFGEGDWAGGLELYDKHRWELEEFAKFRRGFPHPEWAGEPVDGKHLLLWAEQGIGDQVMQARVIGPLLDAGATITIESDPRLHPLVQRTWPDVGVASQTVQLPQALVHGDFDFHGSMLSAWRWAELMQPQPKYLTPSESMVRAFRNAWEKQGWQLNIGLSWRSKAAVNGSLRSIPEPLLSPLLQRRDLTFHSLQYDADIAEVSGLSQQLDRPIFMDRDSQPLKDIDRLAAQIAALDLVISIDNSTVHLAGAVGTPCWVALPAAVDWRWPASGFTTGLYECLRLYRNNQIHHWGAVIADLSDALNTWSPKA